MLELINEAIQYLCVAWIIMFGIPIYLTFLSSLIHKVNYKFDFVDYINAVAIFYLVAAGLPSLKLLN